MKIYFKNFSKPLDTLQKKIITNDIYTIIFEDELFNTDIID